jgi:hypothetical protein
VHWVTYASPRSTPAAPDDRLSWAVGSTDDPVGPMTRRNRPLYKVPDLPVSPIAPGRSVLITGSAISGARELALSLLLAGGDDERTVILSTDVSGATLLRECDDLDPSRLRIVDCSRRAGPPDDDRITRSDPGDLTGAGIAVSSHLKAFYGEDAAGIRVGVDSVSGLLAASEFRPVLRYVNALSGRVETVAGLGVFFLDTSTHEPRVIDALANLLDGRIDVRESGDGEHELRVRRLPDQPEGWRSFPVELQWPRRLGDHLIDRRVTMGTSVSTRYDCLRCDLSVTDDLDAESVADTRCG